MKSFRIAILGSMIALLLGLGCSTDPQGSLLPNMAPETYVAIDTVIRVGEDRLTSRVEIQWWADDPDGYITGYEFTFDAANDPAAQWYYTKTQDSVFLLSPPPGSDTVDFRFRVRAIDNDGNIDQTPAAVSYPVKNSNPTAAIIPGANNPVSSFPALRFYWEGTDQDGADNLDHFELYWNDTNATPFIVDVTVTSAVFEAIDPSSSSNGDVRVYLNNAIQPQSQNMPGLIMNDTNRLYVRAVDKSAASSKFAVTAPVYVKSVNSSYLLIDAYTGTSASTLQFYSQGLIDQGIASSDTLLLFKTAQGEFTRLSPDNFTQSLVFGFFETIFWFGDNASSTLSLAQKSTGRFFDAGGKLFMAIYVSSTFDQQSNFLDFTPIQELVSPADSTLILTDTASIIPRNGNWPTLKSSAFVGVVKPFIKAVGSEVIYDANLTAKYNPQVTFHPWTGNSIVMAKKKNQSGNTNFIISTLELQGLNSSSNINDFFQQVLQNEFAW